MELRAVKIIDKQSSRRSRPDLTSDITSDMYRPIVKYLTFGPRYLEWTSTDVYPLEPGELRDVDSFRQDVSLYKTKEDFHVESIGQVFVPNRVVDLVLVGPAALVNDRRVELSRERRSVRQRLLRRLDRIGKHFSKDSTSPVVCVAYRGKLAVRGRFPGDDIDLLISCESPDAYPLVRAEMLQLAGLLGFGTVDWIEMHPEERRQKRQSIRVDTVGSYRLDCYVTVGEDELLRVGAESPTEALWTLGVLSRSKPVLNATYFAAYVDRYEAAVRSAQQQAALTLEHRR